MIVMNIVTSFHVFNFNISSSTSFGCLLLTIDEVIVIVITTVTLLIIFCSLTTKHQQLQHLWVACSFQSCQALQLDSPIVNPKKLETGLRIISAGIPYTWLLRIEAIGNLGFYCSKFLLDQLSPLNGQEHHIRKTSEPENALRPETLALHYRGLNNYQLWRGGSI